MKLSKLYLTILLSFLVLASCKSKKSDDDIVIPISTLYQNGLDLLAKRKYSKAAEEFGKIFFQHPGDPLTPQSELMQAYSLFLNAEYDEAVDVLDIFIKLHPLNIDIAYAYYLKALSYYMQISNVVLDQSRTELAKSSFEEVIKRFPGTKYAIDSDLKIDLVNDHLAGREMEIGRYYLKRKNPIAAITRFQTVIEHYQTTSHIQEALYRLVESYLSLGLYEDAKKYGAVLGNNYVDSKWYKYSYDLLTKGK
jgi:outer membrane protein assembly factor BamD